MVASGVRDSSNRRVMHHHSVLVRPAVDREWYTCSERKICVCICMHTVVCYTKIYMINLQNKIQYSKQ